MASCPNRNHPDYKKLLEISGYSPEQLDAVIAAYQQEFPGEFPTEKYIKLNERFKKAIEEEPSDINEFELNQAEINEIIETAPPDVVHLPEYDKIPSPEDPKKLQLDAKFKTEPYVILLTEALYKINEIVTSIEAIPVDKRSTREREMYAKYKQLQNKYQVKLERVNTKGAEIGLDLVEAEDRNAAILDMIETAIVDIMETADRITQDVQGIADDGDINDLPKTAIQELRMISQLLDGYKALIADTAAGSNSNIFDPTSKDYTAQLEATDPVHLKIVKAEAAMKKATVRIVQAVLKAEILRRKGLEGDLSDSDIENSITANQEVTAMFDENLDYQEIQDTVWPLLFALDQAPGIDPLASAIKAMFDFEKKRDETNFLRAKLDNIGKKLRKMWGKDYEENMKRFKVKTAQGFNRLIAPLSTGFYDLKKLIDQEATEIWQLEKSANSRIKYNKEQKQKRLNEKIASRNKKIQDNFVALDLTKLSGVALLKNHEQMPEGITFASPDQMAAYEQEMIESLNPVKDPSSPYYEAGMEVARETFDQIVAQQVAEVERYLITSAQYSDSAMDENQVNNALYFKRRDNPFEYNRKLNEGKLDTETTDKYSVLVPRADKAELFDDNFVNNILAEGLLDDWRVMRDTTKYVNDNKYVKNRRGKYDTELSLPYSPELMLSKGMEAVQNIQSTPLRTLRLLLDNLVTYVHDGVRIAISRKPRFQADRISGDMGVEAQQARRQGVESIRPELQDRINTVSEEAQNRVRRGQGAYGRISARLGFQMRDEVNINSPEVQAVLRQELGHEQAEDTIVKAKSLSANENAVRLGDILYYHAVGVVDREMDDTDLIDGLFNASIATADLKMRKELEPKILFLQEFLGASDVKGAKKGVKALASTRRAVDYFVEKKFYGADAVGDKYLGKVGNLKVHTRAEKSIKRDLEQDLAQLEALRNEITDEEALSILNTHIASTKAAINSLGRVITIGSVLEGVLLRGSILSKLGYSITGQLFNFFVGRSSSTMGEGVFWKAGNLQPARNYMYTMKKARTGAAGETGQTNTAITHELLSLQGVFQNSSNELEDSKTPEAAQSNRGIMKHLAKFRPFYIVEYVEKQIQTPVILAMLADVNITSKSGESVPVYNSEMGTADDKYEGQAHPAFEMRDGILRLKDEFDTEENRATWLYQNSREHAELFADSGRIPVAIRHLHGDYANNSTTTVKSHIIGRMFMMFKTWAPMYYKFRKDLFDKLLEVPAGTEPGSEQHKFQQARARKLLALTTMKNMLYAGLISSAVGTSMFLGAAVPFAILTVYAGYKGLNKSQIRQDIIREGENLNENAIRLRVAREAMILSLKQVNPKYLGPAVLDIISQVPATAAKAVQQNIVLNNSLLKVGKWLNITDAKIAEVGRIVAAEVDDNNIDPKVLEEHPEIAERIAAYNALVASASSAVQGALIKVIVGTLLMGLIDDDEDEKGYADYIKGQSEDLNVASGSFWAVVERAMAYPEFFIYNVTSNMANRLVQENVQETNIPEILGLIFRDSPIPTSMDQSFDILDSKEKGPQSPNAGMTGYEVWIKRQLPIDFGFDSYTKKVFDEGAIDKFFLTSEAEAFQDKSKRVKNRFNDVYADVVEEIVAGRTPEAQARVEARLESIRRASGRDLFPQGKPNEKTGMPTKYSFFDASGDKLETARGEKNYSTANGRLDEIENMSEEELKAYIKRYIRHKMSN